MSSAEESPAQKAARLRRERREAKIKASGSARLDKITSLSGRTPPSERETPISASPSPSPSPAPQASPFAQPPSQPSPSLVPSPDAQDPAAIQAQQEYLRALLRSQQPPGENAEDTEDPTMKLLSSLMGNAADDTSGAPPISPSDLSSATGLPPFLTNMFLGGQSQQETPAQKQRNEQWKLLHIVFSLVLGAYIVYLFKSSVAVYGSNPPPPATAQNPFVIFLMGELLLGGGRLLSAGQQAGGLASVWTWVQLVKDMVKDGSIAIFMLGAGRWWMNGS